MPTIDLIWLTENIAPPPWPLGQVVVSLPTPAEILAALDRLLPATRSDACLFWDAALGTPEPGMILETFEHPGDAWHCGLRMGLNGLPGMIDFVDPTWMLNRDPSPDIEATSWRLSLRCSLVRTAVLRALGGPHPEYESLEAASLELGLRWIQCGAFTRHLPGRLPDGYQPAAAQISIEDELRFIHHSKGRRWLVWAAIRAIITGYAPPIHILRAARKISASPAPARPAPYQHPQSEDTGIPSARVSVLIPTIERYSYLRTLLDQLRQQTVRPLDIIIIDQTDPARRDTSLANDFRDLPLTILGLQRPGQCTARNLGLTRANGEYILFLDDDIEIVPDMIEQHIRMLQYFRSDSSSGMVREINTANPSPEFCLSRITDVFPAGNTFVTRETLRRSGLFDPNYDHGPRADHDLGMRVMLSGALMVFNHEIFIIHYHAPAGGLRMHKARVITRDSSRSSLFERHIPAATEIYLAMRYFTTRQVDEMLLQRIIGTLFGEGTRGRRALKTLFSLILLPDTVRKTRANHQKARQMLASPLTIPTLAPVDPRQEDDREAASA